MPNQIDAHDAKNKKRLAKIGTVLPKNLARARVFRSSSVWQKLSKLTLLNEPLCRDPLSIHAKEGTAEPAVEVHHILGLSTNWALRASMKNLSSLCHSCHDKIEKMERSGKRTSYLFKKPHTC